MIQTSYVSNTFNTFFTNIGVELIHNFVESTFVCEEDVSFIFFNSFFRENIKESDNCQIINNFKDNTAVGCDGVIVKILKLVIDSILSPLTYIFNLNIKNDIFIYSEQLFKVECACK